MPTKRFGVFDSPGERGLFDPFRPVNKTAPMSTEFTTHLRQAHEFILDATSKRILAEKRKLKGILAEKRKLKRVRAGAKTSSVETGDLILIRTLKREMMPEKIQRLHVKVDLESPK